MFLGQDYEDLKRRGIEIDKEVHDTPGSWGARQLPPRDSSVQLSEKVGLPIGWSGHFSEGAHGNAWAYVALGADALTHFKELSTRLVAERTPNATHLLGPGPQSLDQIISVGISPAIDSWIEEKFFDPPELWESPVGLFQSRQKSHEQDLALHRERMLAWEGWKQEFRDRLARAIQRQVARLLSFKLGVPARLHDSFEEWIVENPLLSFSSPQMMAWINQPEFPDPPPAEAGGISHREYEDYCCRMLHSWGYLDASTTRYARDGGIDVESSELVVQCKHVKGNVGAPEIQKIFGIASKDDKTAVVFSAGGFTREGIKWANAAGVALFTLKEISGVPTAQNEAASSVMARRSGRD